MSDGVFIVFRIQVVGGPFDGAEGLTWSDDGEHPPPDTIHVGKCRGDGECAVDGCLRRRRPHTVFWVPGELRVPEDALEYRKEDEWLLPEQEGTPMMFGSAQPVRYGVARYAYGELDMFRGDYALAGSDSRIGA